jgi:hypothetical protein
MSCFYDLEKSGTFGVRNSVLRGKGTEIFKTLKARMDEAEKKPHTSLEKRVPLPFMET